MNRLSREGIIAKWSGMNPRERDAWVAEVVFDWNADRIVMAEIAWEACVIGAETIPYYTTDIEDALAVAETFDTWQLTKMGYLGRPDRYRAILRANRFIANAPTAPEAICLAAIIAKLSPEVSA